MKKEYGFYYYRDSENHPLVTVCLLRDPQGVICKGIAICSPDDNPEKSEGRYWSLGRARAAAGSKKIDEPVLRWEPDMVTARLKIPAFTFKSIYGYYDFSPIEQKIVDLL